MHRLSRIRLAALLAILSANASWADDWPHWRGPTGMGLAEAKDLPLTWGGKENGNVLWKTSLPGSTGKAKPDLNQSSPIVRDNRIFLIMVYWPEGVAQSEMPEHHVVAYAAEDGKQLWDTKVEPGPWLLKDLRGGYSAPTPCCDGARVYALFGSSVVVALDLDGKLQWRKEIAPYGWDVAIGTSPVLYKDTLIVLADASSSKISRLIAFDKKTGELRWERKRPTNSFNHSTPALIEANGKPQLLIASSNAVQGVDPEDGKVIWWVNHKGDVPTPVFGKGIVYSDDGRGGSGIALSPLGEGDVSKSMVKWRTASTIPEGYSSPIIAGEYLYRMHNPGILKCWKLSTGEQLYSERMPAGLDGSVSPIAAPDDRIYFACGGKSVVVAGGPKFEVLATNDLGDPGKASPAVANGRIYVKGGKFLYCIGKKE